MLALRYSVVPGVAAVIMNGITTAGGIKSDASANISTEMQEASVPASSWACGHPVVDETKVRANFSVGMVIIFAAVIKVNFFLSVIR